MGPHRTHSPTGLPTPKNPGSSKSPEQQSMLPMLTIVQLGVQAGNYIHFMAKFIAGFVVAFCSVWQLSLTTLAVVPAIVLAGAAYALTMIGHETKSLAAYEEAGKVAQQVYLRFVHAEPVSARHVLPCIVSRQSTSKQKNARLFSAHHNSSLLQVSGLHFDLEEAILAVGKYCMNGNSSLLSDMRSVCHMLV